MKPSRRSTTDGPSGFALIEEAIHLLRRSPARVFVAYFGGAVPWVAGVLYFWARASWFAPGAAERLFSAALLVVLFAALKTGQSVFCAHLMALRLGAPAPEFRFGDLRRIAAAQLRFQTWGWFALPLAAAVAAPFGWIYAFYQNATVLGALPRESTPLRREAWAQAELWPAQNHLGLVSIKLLGGAIWLNLASSIYLVPWLANRLFGIENLFAIRGIALFNSTFLALTTMLAWLAVDPLVKAFYTLRLFHGRARRTGADLRTELAAVRPAGARPRLAVVALLAFLALAPTPRALAAEAPPEAERAAGTIAPDQLDQALDRTLEAEDFQWSLRPLPREDDGTPRNAFERFIDDCYEFLVEMLRSVGRAIGRFFDWLERIFTRRDRGSAPGPIAPTGGFGGARILLYLLFGGVLLVLVWVVVQFWRNSRPAKNPTALAARPVAEAEPDLRDETIQAAQLPTDGWLDLARRQITAGEWRLALRALYLATLALRANEGLLVLARHKTNLDYERELARRALARQDLVAHFRDRRRNFEDVWYGDSAATEPQVREWLAEFTPTSDQA